MRVTLNRETTFWISLADLAGNGPVRCAGSNTWLGAPGPRGFGFPLHVGCRIAGAIAPTTGMLLNVKLVDGVLRNQVWPEVLQQLRATMSGSPAPAASPAPDCAFEQLLPEIDRAIRRELPETLSLEETSVASSPKLRYVMNETHEISITEQFEFSASHRLFYAGWDESENERHFGKCSRPGGHGHNYLLDVTVSGTPDPVSGQVMSVTALEGIVRELVIARLDHRNLDEDLPELKGRPSTAENLAQLAWQWLDGQFGDVQLQRVRVSETPRTFAECSRPN